MQLHQNGTWVYGEEEVDKSCDTLVTSAYDDLRDVTNRQELTSREDCKADENHLISAGGSLRQELGFPHRLWWITHGKEDDNADARHNGGESGQKP